MRLFRHRRLLHFRQIKHVLWMRKVQLRAITLSYIREQEPYLSLDRLQQMTPEEREELRQRNPEFPSTFFMTAEEKKEYFREVGEEFIRGLENYKPHHHNKTKKIVKFIGRVEHIYDPNSQILDEVDWC